MKHIWVKAKIGDPSGVRIIEVEALVDTGERPSP